MFTFPNSFKLYPGLGNAECRMGIHILSSCSPNQMKFNNTDVPLPLTRFNTIFTSSEFSSLESIHFACAGITSMYFIIVYLETIFFFTFYFTFFFQYLFYESNKFILFAQIKTSFDFPYNALKNTRILVNIYHYLHIYIIRQGKQVPSAVGTSTMCMSYHQKSTSSHFL